MLRLEFKSSNSSPRATEMQTLHALEISTYIYLTKLMINLNSAYKLYGREYDDVPLIEI